MTHTSTAPTCVRPPVNSRLTPISPQLPHSPQIVALLTRYVSSAITASCNTILAKLRNHTLANGTYVSEFQPACCKHFLFLRTIKYCAVIIEIGKHEASVKGAAHPRIISTVRHFSSGESQRSLSLRNAQDQSGQQFNAREALIMCPNFWIAPRAHTIFPCLYIHGRNETTVSFLASTRAASSFPLAPRSIASTKRHQGLLSLVSTVQLVY